jgi:hypothetical protein
MEMKIPIPAITILTATLFTIALAINMTAQSAAAVCSPKSGACVDSLPPLNTIASTNGHAAGISVLHGTAAFSGSNVARTNDKHCGHNIAPGVIENGKEVCAR